MKKELLPEASKRTAPPLRSAGLAGRGSRVRFFFCVFGNPFQQRGERFAPVMITSKQIFNPLQNNIENTIPCYFAT